MTNQPLFSVLIANYNNGKYLMEAIESVRRQTYANWEIILVDDSSTDNSHELYKELEQDERIHIFLNDQNHGCGYTKRRCAELANGEICGFLDPDDALTEDALEVMVEEHIRNKDICMVYSRYFVCDSNLNIQSVSEHQYEIKTSFLEEQRGAISHFVTFKKKYYQKSDGISETILRAVDHELYFRLEEVGPSCFVDIPLYFYRTETGHNISLGSNSTSALFWDYIVVSDACRRRGMSVEKYAFPLLQEYMKEVETIACAQGELRVQNTKSYRLGKLILSPFKQIKDLIKK